MDRFVVKLSPQAEKDLDELEDKTANRILSYLKIIEENPYPRGKVVKKIKGKKSTFYRLKAGKFRIFYFIQGIEIIILKIVSKKDSDRYIRDL